MLENATTAPHMDDRGTQHNRGDHVAAPTAAMANEASLTHAPRIPEWLYHARAPRSHPAYLSFHEATCPEANNSRRNQPCPRPSPTPALFPGQDNLPQPAVIRSRM